MDQYEEIQEYKSIFRKLIMDMEEGKKPQWVLFLETEPETHKTEFMAECTPEFMGQVRDHIGELLKPEEEVPIRYFLKLEFEREKQKSDETENK